jgi:hypothetical protein
MARTVDEIKQSIADSFLSNETVRSLYGDAQLPASSVESVLFHSVAQVVQTLERLFDVHRAEVAAELLAKMPHTARWYREKVLRFQHPNRALIPDSDRYDNAGLSADDVARLEVVKYCAVGENSDELKIKVAKGEPGKRTPLADGEASALSAYLAAIRDAGVRIALVNAPADALALKIDIYYSPLLLSPAAGIVEDAVRQYISNLEFNGALSATRLTDALQAIPGVELVNITSAKVWGNTPLGVQKIATSGYWKFSEENDLQVNYIVYSGEANL